MSNGQKIFIAILTFIIIIYWASGKPEKSNPTKESTISSTDYYIIDKNFTDEGAEYTRLVVWVYSNDMTKNMDIAKKIEKDLPASKFTNKKMWLSINFFTDKSINKIDPEFGDKIKQLIKIDTYSGNIIKNEIPPKQKKKKQDEHNTQNKTDRDRDKPKKLIGRFLRSDINGDNIVDAEDVSLVDNNSYNSIVRITP